MVVPYGLTVLYRLDAIHPVSTLMLRDLVLLRGYDRQWVEFDKISPVLVQSVLMSEDGHYCSHSGVDWEALNTQIDRALEGEASRGASTLPMQTAKNLFLWSGRSFVRKGLEVPLALFISQLWSKTRLMEIYLNVAEWAPGVYGIEAGALHHFGVRADKLTTQQAALLAVTLPNPHLRNPAKPSDGLRKRANAAGKRAQQSGAYIKCLYG